MKVTYYKMLQRYDATLFSIWGLREDGNEKCYTVGSMDYESYHNWTPTIEGDIAIDELVEDGIMVEITEEEAFLDSI